MSVADPRRLEWMLAALAVIVCAAAAVLVTAQPGSPAPGPRRQTAAPTTPSPEPKRGLPARLAFDLGVAGAGTTRVPTAVHQAPEGSSPVVSRLRPGILLPVEGIAGSFVRVLTPCQASGWVRSADLVLHPRANGPPKSFGEATIVLDPGHGGLQRGAVGPNGLPEKDANLAIARRLAARLGGARVFVTRNADVTAGLQYRASIANALRAHALVSIHNNSAPDGPSDHPGTETWHQGHSPAAQRLSGLLYGELREALKSFKIAWVSDRKAGTRTRVNQHGHDYYGLLRGSIVPTVIVEAMFISNAPEAELLTRPEGQDAVAGALARSLKLYVEGAGPEVTEPYRAAVGTFSGLPTTCVDPA